MSRCFKYVYIRVFILYLALASIYLAGVLKGFHFVPDFLYFTLIACIIMLFGVWFVLYPAKHIRGWLNSFFAVIVLFEVLLNIASYNQVFRLERTDINSGFGYFNEACARFDKTAGFVWLPGEHRIFKGNSNAVVYDNHFKVNNRGYYASTDYEFQQSDSTKRRFLILGDSFTAAEFLEEPMVDYLNGRLKGSEFYSFSVNGGGLANWHSIFYNELVPNYDFDGIILNVFGNDFQRDFFMMHHEQEQGYTLYSDSIPKSTDDFMANYLPLADPFAPILEDAKLDSIVHYCNQQEGGYQFELYVPRLFVYLPILAFTKYKWNQFLSELMVQQDELVNLEVILGYYGKERLKMLEEMVAYCKENDKSILICSVPYEFGVYALKRGEILRELAYLEFLCEHWDLNYFNGYEPYLSYDNEVIENCFFPGDTHWNQRGSMIYLRDFQKFFLKQELN